MSSEAKVDRQLVNQLDALRDQPGRDPRRAAQARAAFLSEAAHLAASFPSVSPTRQRRLIGWMHALQSFFTIRRKEQSPMMSILSAFLVIAVLALGGSGVTVVAAQDSLPGQALYPVKTWSETVRVWLTEREQARLQLALELAERRAEEMQMILRTGQIPPETVAASMQTEIDLALDLAAGQPDMEMFQALTQIRARLQQQEQAFQNFEGIDPYSENFIRQTRTMLRERLQLCEEGINDPDRLRQRLRDRDRQHEGTVTSTPLAQPSRTATPDRGNSDETGPKKGEGGNNPWTVTTPTPGSGNGPGPGGGEGGNNPWTVTTPTPGSGYGPGPGDGEGGNNPWTVTTPTPGNGYGPGPGDGSGGSSENPGGENVGGNADAGSSPGNHSGEKNESEGGTGSGDTGSGAGNGPGGNGGGH